MKNFFRTSFIILALVIGATGSAPAAHAQPNETPTAEEQAIIDQQSSFSDDNYGTAQSYDTMYETTPEYKAAANTQTPYKPGDAEDFFAPVMQQVMKLFAWLVGAAALTLDYSVYYTVVNMGSYVNDLAAVGVTWRILRDIGNIVIIFGFLGIGIAIILNVNWYGGGFKMLPMLFVAAVFLNFSLFLSEAVIDAGNLFATQIYTQIKGGQLPTAASLSGTTILDAIERDGISTKIMSQLGLTTIYGNAVRNPQVFAAGNSLLIGFMGIILFLVTAFVLFSLAFVLISRFVMLLFLIIIAPIGFAGLAVPQLKSAAKKWWDALFQQTITAPVLLLLLYIALAIITDVQFLTGLGVGKGKIDADWTGGITNNNLAGFGGVMLSFLVAMGLLLAVVIFSKKLSAFGAGMATKVASRLSGATLVAAGLAKGSRYIGRNTLGRAGNTGWGKALGMGGLANASFDFRNSKLAKTAQTRTGLDLGTGGKGGYKTYAAEATKKKRDTENTAELNQAEQLKNQQQQHLSQLQTQHNTAAAEYAKQNTEVERLEKAEKNRATFNVQSSPAEQRELDAVHAAAAKSKTDVETTSKRLADVQAALKEINQRADRARERIEKMKDRDAIAELRESLKETAERTKKEPAEAKTEKKEAKPDDKK